VPEERPVPVTVFLGKGENDLARGDIVLSRSRTWISRLVRFVTGSEFSHAALVFLVPKYEEGFSSTFVLESTRRGVSLARLEDYVDRKTGHSDVVILRLVGKGFDEAYFKRVRGLMLNHIMLQREQGDAMREAIRRTRRNRKLKGVPPEFICSGFIQYGLVQAAKYADQKRAALLKGDINYRDDDALLGVTPEDIARSTKLTWCWAIARGRARRVGSYGEALAFMNGGK
jgi:hypothetical protein